MDMPMKNNFVIKSILVVAPLVMLTACQTTGSTSGALQAYQPNLEPLSQDTSILPVGTTADFYEGFDFSWQAVAKQWKENIL